MKPRVTDGTVGDVKEHQLSIVSTDFGTGDGVHGATRANFEYLVSTLSKRTRGKKYENFVVNYIWSSLGDDTLKPVTQQYVNRRLRHQGSGLVDAQKESWSEAEGANFALVDLYFPALHLGIECDEGFHSGKSKEDKIRLRDIQDVIPDYVELRIPVELGNGGTAIQPSAIIDDLDAAVRFIRERKSQVERGDFSWGSRSAVTWRTSQPDWRLALEAGVIRAEDGYLFRHNGEIRELFGLGDGTGERRNSYRTNFDPRDGKHVVWCPSLVTTSRSGIIRSSNSGGHLNRIFVEESKILIGEASPNARSSADRAVAKKAGQPLPDWDYKLSAGELANRLLALDTDVLTVPGSGAPDWRTARRITFVRTKDGVGREGFQFLGVFSPPSGRREADGIVYFTSRLESDQFELSGGPRTSAADSRTE